MLLSVTNIAQRMQDEFVADCNLAHRLNNEYLEPVLDTEEPMAIITREALALFG